jgi:transposase
MYQLKVTQQQMIVALHEQGWSKRRIAREFGVDRNTVRRYLRGAFKPSVNNCPVADANSPANPQTGSAPDSPTPQTGPSAAALAKAGALALGGAGPDSLCEPWKEVIEAALTSGLSIQRIYQDLVAERQFAGSYHSVRRFALRLGKKLELPFRRMEVAPGAELQVDFGQGAWVVDASQKRRRPHLFRAVLSHSRKGYSEAVLRQTTEAFIRCLENAFRYFGGVTQSVVIDNLKAAVRYADWFDPELNPKLEEFCRHYGTVVLPCKPKMPRHKGKVESGVNYGQENAVKGRSFKSLSEQNRFLLEWEKSVADKRIHGTTKRQVEKVFNGVERPALRPLPQSLFPFFEEAQRTVHRDGHIELQKAYYSVPPEYVGRKVWARWEARLVRIYNLRLEPIALHARAEPGKFSTDAAHIHSHKRALIERGADWLLDRARLIGKNTGTWAEAMFRTRGPQSIRVLQGLLALAEKQPAAQLERVCDQALEHGAWRLRDLRALLERAPAQQQLSFLEKHPLIRDLEAYGNLVPVCFNTETTTTQTKRSNDDQQP